VGVLKSAISTYPENPLKFQNPVNTVSAVKNTPKVKKVAKGPGFVCNLLIANCVPRVGLTTVSGWPLMARNWYIQVELSSFEFWDRHLGGWERWGS
jgi:hypothetical protein